MLQPLCGVFVGLEVGGELDGHRPAGPVRAVRNSRKAKASLGIS